MCSLKIIISGGTVYPATGMPPWNIQHKIEVRDELRPAGTVKQRGGIMYGRRAFRTPETVMVASLSSVLLLIGMPDGANGVHITEPMPNAMEVPVPGITYALAEVECRQWHRNRANRPYNFALKQ